MTIEDTNTDDGKARSLWTSGLHLLALSSFALAQPLLDLLRQDATFFVARRSQPIDIWLLTLILISVVPVTLFLIEALLYRVSARLQTWVHSVFVLGFVTLICLPPFRRGLEGAPVLTLALAVGAGVAVLVAYLRFRPIGTFLSVLAPAALLFAGTFLAQPAIRSLTGTGGADIEVAVVDSDTTVVMVILDELPVASLLTPDLEVDAKLFPNFARLAADSTWFRNTTASHTSSERAVPAIMTGFNPKGGKELAIATDHPKSIFTLLGGSHRMRVHENFTALLPESLKSDEQRRQAVAPLGRRMSSMLRDVTIIYGHMILPDPRWLGLPEISGQWGGFGQQSDTPAVQVGSASNPGQDEASRAAWNKERQKRVGLEKVNPTPAVMSFIDVIDDSKEPTLYFMHALTPHHPWTNTPSGKLYDYDEIIAGYRDAKGRPGFDEEVWPPALAYQRHMLQVIHLDGLIGQLLDRLHEKGVYDDCLLVIVADHGAAFRPDEHMREASEVNARDILHVPLFVKLPGQRQARSDDRNVEGIDVIPTIAGALGIALPWEMDGRSALDDAVPPREKKTLGRNRRAPIVVDGTMPTEFHAVDQKVRLFGEPEDWSGLYSLSSRSEWLGRAIAELAPDPPEYDGEASLYQSVRFEYVDPAALSVPSYIEGTLNVASGVDVPHEVLVAIQGRVRAVVPTHDREQSSARFAAMVPDDSFGEGFNDVDIFVVDESGAIAHLKGNAPRFTYGLVRQGGERLLRSDGQEVPIVRGAVHSNFDRAYAEEGVLILSGWAIDETNLVAPDRLLLFAEGRETAIVCALGSARKDLTARFGPGDYAESCGFRLQLPFKLLGGDPTGRLRMFAIAGDVASEMRYGKTAEWLEGS